MVGFQIQGDIGGADVLALFNNQPFHTPPMALAIADLALIHAVTKNSNITISTSNHPLPRTDIEKVTRPKL